MKIPIIIDGQEFLLQRVEVKTMTDQMEVIIKAQSLGWFPKLATVIFFLPNHVKSQFYKQENDD